MTSIIHPSGRRPTGLHSAADLMSATRKAILLAVLALLLALVAIAAAATPLLHARGSTDDPGVPTLRDLARRLDQMSADLDRLRQNMQQRESTQADLLDQQKRLSDGLAALTQETTEMRTRLTRDLTALRTQMDGVHPPGDEVEKSAPRTRPGRRGRARRSMTFTIPER